MLNLAYCDKIAHEIQKALSQPDPDGIIDKVGPVKLDLDDAGILASTAKSITVHDANGKAYIVSIQDAELLDR